VKFHNANVREYLKL